MMAHGIVAVSIMTALMPRLAAAAADGRFRDLADQFSHGYAPVLGDPDPGHRRLHRAGPAARGDAVPVARTYTHDEAMQTGTVIAVAAIGLVPFAISQMQLFAFYAMPDTKTPALAEPPGSGRPRARLHRLLRVLSAALVDAGLMMANTISFVFAVILGYVAAAPSHRPARAGRDQPSARQARRRGA